MVDPHLPSPQKKEEKKCLSLMFLLRRIASQKDHLNYESMFLTHGVTQALPSSSYDATRDARKVVHSLVSCRSPWRAVPVDQMSRHCTCDALTQFYVLLKRGRYHIYA